jgi:hypothetical protein
MRQHLTTSIGAILLGASSLVQAGEPTATAADWSHAQPVASLAVRPMTPAEAPASLKDRDGMFVIEGTIIDLQTGNPLMKPRLIVHRGDTATIEGGVFDRVMIKLTVLIDPSVDSASTTTELRDNGIVTSSSTTRFSFARL